MVNTSSPARDVMWSFKIMAKPNKLSLVVIILLAPRLHDRFGFFALLSYRVLLAVSTPASSEWTVIVPEMSCAPSSICDLSHSCPCLQST